MVSCFSYTSSRDTCYRYTFSNSDLRSSTTDLGDGTVMHAWVPRSFKSTKPSLVLLHGIGANAMWQWSDFISSLGSRFNLFIPDLLFFGDSYTTRPDRSEEFQARCVVGLMEAHGVRVMSVAGISYGGFVGYSMAAQFKERVERVVLCCAGVCLEEKDMEDGLFQVKSVDEAASILFPQTAANLRRLLQLAFYKPPMAMPSCFANDYIRIMCTEYLQERKELIEALHKDRKLSTLPKITQPALIIWGERDEIFPPVLADRLKRHLGDNAKLVTIKKAGHAINIEKPKKMYKHMKSFLLDLSPGNKQGDKINGNKRD